MDGQMYQYGGIKIQKRSYDVIYYRVKIKNLLNVFTLKLKLKTRLTNINQRHVPFSFF